MAFPQAATPEPAGARASAASCAAAVLCVVSRRRTTATGLASGLMANTPGESSRFGSHLTRRWREPDSNFSSPQRGAAALTRLTEAFAAAAPTGHNA
jgi:hypothetical protein